MELAGKVTVITGGAGGIGSALARRFAAEGAAGVVVADRDVAGATRVAEEIEAAHPGVALAVACDVADDQSTGALIGATQATFGPIDLYFANAGVGLGTDLDTSDEDWDRSFAINTKAHYYAARRLVPGWLARGDGYFCSTASAPGCSPRSARRPARRHQARRGGLRQWLSVTYGGHGLKVSCPMPGVNTNILKGSELASTGAAWCGRRARWWSRVRGRRVRRRHPASASSSCPTEVLTFFQRRPASYDRWLSGMRRLQARPPGVTAR
jgi:NAD(P)-dependent dehydrogenase (short-subunit alcohol dehydrogenase family)